MKPSLDILDLGHQAYTPVLDIQRQMVEQRRNGEIPDTLILVEHDPVYTLGRSAKQEHVLASEQQLQQRGIEVVKTDRGGDVTYHGPGQLVGYPILDLAAREKGVLWYIQSLERLIMLVLADFGIESSTDRQNRGVWVGNNKIAAIGVRITRHITMHGFSLNVCVDLSHYDFIVPCGITGKGVTSLNLLVDNVSMKEVKEKTIARFQDIFCPTGS